MSKCGIYKITCTANNKFYIGSSKDIEFRFKRHIMFLRNLNHVNTHMQNSFNKYGKDSFILEIIEECKLEKLIDLENYWIKKTNCLDRRIGFNKRDGASGGTTMSGKEHYLYGKHLSNETKRKISESKKGRCGAENHPSRKLDWKDVNTIRNLSLHGLSNREISSRYNMSYSQIYRIVTNKAWSI